MIHFYTLKNVSKPKLFQLFRGYRNGTLKVHVFYFGTNKQTQRAATEKYFDFIFPCRLELYGVIVGWYEIYECHSVE